MRLHLGVHVFAILILQLGDKAAAVLQGDVLGRIEKVLGHFLRCCVSGWIMQAAVGCVCGRARRRPECCVVEKVRTRRNDREMIMFGGGARSNPKRQISHQGSWD
jgi:hypothetical protein